MLWDFLRGRQNGTTDADAHGRVEHVFRVAMKDDETKRGREKEEGSFMKMRLALLHAALEMKLG